MIIVGLDPGKAGAMAWTDGRRARVQPFPMVKVTKTKKDLDEIRIRDWLEKRREAIQHVFIEKVNAMPGQGVTSCFTFGTGWGLLRGLCVGLHLPYTLVHPTTWKGVICRDMPKDKGVSITVAKRLWPDVSLLPTPRCKTDSDGMADALCIAEYGRRSLGGR